MSAKPYLVLTFIAVAGLVVDVAAWFGSHRLTFVPYQIPWVVSGAVIGTGLLGVGLGAIAVHTRRVIESAEKPVEEMFLDAVASIEAVLARPRSARHRSTGARSRSRSSKRPSTIEPLEQEPWI